MPIADIITDGLIKALPRQIHEEFVRQIRLDDITERLKEEQQLEALKDKMLGNQPEETVFWVHKGVKAPKEARLGKEKDTEAVPRSKTPQKHRDDHSHKEI